jgi:hypothetical protein
MDYKNGYVDALAWARATVTMMATTLRDAPSRNQVHRVELDAAAQVGSEICRIIDEHVAEFLELNKDPEGTVH